MANKDIYRIAFECLPFANKQLDSYVISVNFPDFYNISV